MQWSFGKILSIQIGFSLGSYEKWALGLYEKWEIEENVFIIAYDYLKNIAYLKLWRLVCIDILNYFEVSMKHNVVPYEHWNFFSLILSKKIVKRENLVKIFAFDQLEKCLKSWF